MASTSASPVQKSIKYDVFLSFRGEDTRKNFVDHLYHALRQKGVITYKDDEKIVKGERISDQLVTSIEESRFYIIVFSKNYASSSWCLDELVKIMECQKTKEHTAYPVFYDVEPTEVRNQSGAVGEAFAKLVAKYEKGSGMLGDVDLENEDDVGRWRNALKDAASLAGWELKNTVDGHEAKFIQKIVTDISLKQSFFNWSFDGKLVGMETRVKNVVLSLETGCDDVRVIGIKGMGGSGKTTLARAIFDLISVWFEGKSFVENVSEVSKGSGLKKLQKQVLKDVLNDQNVDVTSVFEGKNMMKKMMGSRKSLVVLDDVDGIDQLEALAGELTWFKPRSRIIITTRDKQVLVAQRVNFIHDASLLLDHEAICLLSRYAFGRDIPDEGYEDLSRKVVHYAAGLPLTIKVLGSHLCGRSKREWVDALERLKTIPEDQTLKRLELSFNGLENDQKEMFLDVVCLLKYKNKDDAIRILESCGFNAQIGLSVLEQKSFITISDNDSLCFHDHIEEMGWDIVRRGHPDEPRRHSRLWIRDEIEDILVNESGTEATKSIKLTRTDLHPTIIIKGLRKMKKLRFLHVVGRYEEWKAVEDSMYLPHALRFLYWDIYACPPFSQRWEVGERKVFDKLVYLHLWMTKLRTFDLGMTPHLETLKLVLCDDLVEIRRLNECPKLKFLDLSYSNVTKLNLGKTPHLEELDLRGCRYLEEIHAPVGCLKKLVYLDLSGCRRFEDFLVDQRKVLPGPGSLAKLELMGDSLDKCMLHPNSNLPKFMFTCKYDEALPSSSGNLEKLLSFGACACTNLESFSASICGLQHLAELTLEGSIPEALIKDLHRLESLENLALSMTHIKHLPDSICAMKHLKILQLFCCFLLEQLPENLDGLECLEKLRLIGCTSIREIPNSICRMNCLKYLDLRYCTLEELPEELGCLKCLEMLVIEDAGISHLPRSIYDLKGLTIGGSREQLESYGFTSMIETIEGTLNGHTIWCCIIA